MKYRTRTNGNFNNIKYRRAGASLLWMLGLFFLAISTETKGDQKPQVTISFPPNETLIRANVPVFGTACMPNQQQKFKRWYLEYGAGRAPEQWTRIKESEKPVSYDPYPEGKIIWNLNKEPTGNLTNWAVGLTSYTYANWGKNLNGIYTLRLVAEAEDGTSAETRRFFYVGEALIRLFGGTGISSDLKCRLLVPPFSFDGDQARVVAIIKQLPPPDIGKCKTLKGVEETDKSAQEIYNSTTDEFQLASAIYRIYPNGIKTEPPSSLEIDFSPEEFTSPNLRATATGDSMLYQWNPVVRLWEPLKTSWFGNVAKAEVNSLSEYTTYVALMKRLRPISVTSVSWDAISALTGYWIGKTNPFTTIKISTLNGKGVECISDENGNFRLLYHLNAGFNQYRFEFMPPEGKPFSKTMDVVQKSGGVVTSMSPTLSLLGDPIISSSTKLTILCQDPSLNDTNIKDKRSIVAQVQTPNFSRNFTVELSETVAGTGNFIGCIAPLNFQDSSPEKSSPLISYLPSHLANGDKITLSVGTATINLTVRDTDPPNISLSSSTHPCLLFATPNSENSLTSAQLHSRCGITVTNGAWKLTGIPGTPASARIVNWPTPTFPVSSWPFIGFTYKLFSQAPWQLILRSNNKIRSYHLGCDNAWLDAYAATEPLTADGTWHYWQRNLTEGDFKQIDSISFGSWIKTGFLRVDPGFPDFHRDSIFIKNLWIGRSYTDRLVEIAWKIEDDSSIANLDWWVDQEVDSAPDVKTPTRFIFKTLTGPLPSNGKCLFTLPDDGKWFFHIRVTDVAGNASSVSSFPLIVYSTQGKMETMANALLNPTEAQDISWSQPDGILKVNLQGFGTSLNPNTLILHVGNIAYPLIKVGWDASSEILTVTRDSFSGTIPLGFDREILTATLEGKDITGKPILNFPDLKIHIESPFHWSPSKDGGTLNSSDYDPKNQWIAYWKNPAPPWMTLFPDCVNNVLVLTKGKSIKEGKTVPQIRWLRPFNILSDDVQSIYWLENWNDPTAKQVPIRDSFDKIAYSWDGSFASIQGRFTPREPDRNIWIYVQSPSDPFEPSTLRLLSRQPGKEATLSRATQNDLIDALNRQSKNIIRLDGWLPPGAGTINIKAPGKRTIQFAEGADPSYRQVRNNELKIEAEDEWKKFTILITPAHDYKPVNGAIIKGTYYW